MKIESDLLNIAATRQLNIDEYKQIFIFLSNTPHNYTIDLLSPINIIKILSFLNFYDETLYEISRDLARVLLKYFPDEFANNSSTLLMSLISADNDALTMMIFDELTHRIDTNKDNCEVMKFTTEFIEAIFDMVFIDNQILSSSAQKLLIDYCKQRRELCSEAFGTIFKPKFSKISLNMINFFRYIEMCLEIGSNTCDRQLFEEIFDRDVTDKLTNIIIGDDLLAHVNVLETIGRLVEQQLGYELMTKSGILSKLNSGLLTVSQQPLYVEILLPGYLTVFAHLCTNHCLESLKSYSSFVKVLSDNITCSQRLLQIQILEIVAAIVAVPECKLLMASEYNDLVISALQELKRLVGSSSTDDKVRSGNAIAIILSVPSNHKDFQSISSINHNWFLSINTDNKLFSTIFSLMKYPSEDLKLVGLIMAMSLSNQDWGVRVICDNTDMIDFLMLRSDEWKSCIDIKFDLISNLVESFNRSPDLCDVNNSKKIKQYFQEGKYYAPFRAEMMVEDDI